MSPLAHIRGGGLAGASAAQSLGRLGWQVNVSAATLRQGRAVALNGASRFLIENLWNDRLLPGVAMHRLGRRIIAWRGTHEVQAMEDEAIVADSAALARALQPYRAAESSAKADWIFAEASQERRLTGGKRTATTVEVVLGPNAEADALLIEATTAGWLALLPTGGPRAMLFAFALDSGNRLAELVDGSRLVRRSIVGRTATSTSFSAAPTFGWAAAEAGRQFAIGSAAMTFDPLSGDGVASAIRSAHLAAALADAAHRGATSLDDARAAYASRLARAMTVHLQGLIKLYAEAPFAAAWADEIAATEEMIEALAPLAENAGAPSFPISGHGVLATATP